MRIKTSPEKRILYFKTAVRWTLYYILIFFCFIIMSSGTWLKPILLIPIAVGISINNNQYGSVVTGALCGFLIDICCGKLFGYNAVILAVTCIATSLLFELYLRNRFINYIIITAAVSFVQCWLDYKFYYEIWNYDNVRYIFTHYTLKIWLYTVISAIFIYLVLKLINRFLMPKEHLTIEEAKFAKNQ